MNNIINLTLENMSYINSLLIYDYAKKTNDLVGKDVLNDLCENDNLFNELCNLLLNKEIKYLEFKLLNQQKIKVNKLSFLRTFYNYLIERNLDSQKVEKILKIISKYSYQKLIDNSQIIEFNIENQEVKISTKYFIEFLEMSDDLLNKIISNKEKYYHGIEIEKFVYALMTYIDNNDLTNKYIFNDSIIERLKKIRSMELIDYYHINKHLETNDKFLKDVKINKRLEKILFEDQDKYEDKFEYIVYIYLKLCKIFDYDKEYFLDKLSDEGMKHSDIKNLYKLDKDNSKLVCFEFTQIFGYFLNKLGINYEILNYGGSIRNEYGFIHNTLAFRYDKFCIKLDPIESIFSSDLTAVKVNKPLRGLTCLNPNINTRKEFNEKLNSIYKPLDTDLNRLYLPRNKFNNSKELTSELSSYIEKLDLSLAEVKEQDLGIIEKVAYLLDVVKKAFSSVELTVNVDSCVIHEGSEMKIVFCVNEISYRAMDNIYLVCDYNSFTFISKEDLQAKFDNKEYEYINEKTIPGIYSKRK